MTTKAIDTSADLNTVIGLEDREKEILQLIHQKLDFKLSKNIWKSSYWGSKQIGAANYLGEYQGKKAVLKIQGAKPLMSEIDVLQKFKSQNQSHLVRTAKVYNFLRWSDDLNFEAIIMEYVDGQKIIQSHQPTTEAEIDDFLFFYQDYRQNCRQKPWLAKPTQLPDIDAVYQKLLAHRESIYPHHPLVKASDIDLINQGIIKLKQLIKLENLEFVHGHLSAEDIFKFNDQYVIFSNLFWSWKHPYSDLVFAYHWLIYNLAESPATDRQLIEDQRQLWISKMFQIVSDERQFKIALLERALAGLVIDAFAYIDPKNPAASLLVESTRDQIKHLLSDKILK
jgi:hypothetical protein